MMKNKFLVWIFVFIVLSSSVSAISLSASIPEKYSDVKAGERLYFEIDIKYPENDMRKDLILEYEVLNEDNKLVKFDKTLKAIETQASFIEDITIPESIAPGLYILNIKVSDYESLNEEVSTSFFVIKDSSNTLEVYIFIIIGVVSILTILVLISLFKLNSLRRRGNESII